jgi:hypothetical protein
MQHKQAYKNDKTSSENSFSVPVYFSAITVALARLICIADAMDLNIAGVIGGPAVVRFNSGGLAVLSRMWLVEKVEKQQEKIKEKHVFDSCSIVDDCSIRSAKPASP